MTGNYNLVSFDAGTTWWNFQYAEFSGGWKIEGPADMDVVRRCQAFKEIGQRKNPLDLHKAGDLALLSQAGFIVIRRRRKDEPRIRSGGGKRSSRNSHNEAVMVSLPRIEGIGQGREILQDRPENCGQKDQMIDTIQCCDYLELLRKVPDASVSLVLTDPPFGIGYQNNYTHEMHEVMAGDDDEFDYVDLARQSFRVLRDDCAFFAYTGWSEYPLHYLDIEGAGFKMQEPLIVQKRPSGKTNLYGSFQSNADWLLFASKGAFKFRKTELLQNKRAGTVPNIGRKPVGKYKTRFPACWFGKGLPWSDRESSVPDET